MNRAKLLLLIFFVVVYAVPLQASNPIKLVRQPFSNGEAIKLNMQAQDQMQKGDLTSAAQSISLAMQKDPALWLTYFMRARLSAREHKYEAAIDDCNWVLRKYPKFIEAALLRAQCNAHLGKYSDSLRELNYLVQIRPHLDSYARALWNRAWLLATCPNAALRNGTQAVQDAKTACKLTNWNDEAALESLAAAYAEVGDFDSAIRYGEQALGVKGVSLKDSQKIQRHLQLYKQRQPVRSS